MIAITVDCEQWNAPALRGKTDSENGNTLYSFEGNKKLLGIFKKQGVKATFFTTSFFAEQHSEQVRTIAENHEIASHGHCHFYRGNKHLDLSEDIQKSKKILETIIGKKVIGFRAPQMQYSSSLISLLKKYGFLYDSSIHSVWFPGFYNNRDKPLKPFTINDMREIPASGSYYLRLPISWLFLRMMPLWYSVGIVKGLLRRGILPVIYVHSWEFYPVKSKTVPWYVTLWTGDTFCTKFVRFLVAFKNEEFVLMKDL